MRSRPRRSSPTATCRSASPTPAPRRCRGTSPSPEPPRPRSRSRGQRRRTTPVSRATRSTPDGVAAGTTAGTSFTVADLDCSNGYELEVEAFDAGGSTSPRASVNGSTTACEVTPGLIAAYAFEEGAGSLAYDASGSWRNGVVSGATWAAGRNGSGLSLDGVDDHVNLGGLGTFYTAGFTLEAWVRKGTTKKDVAVVGSWAGNGPMLWVDHVAGHHQLTLGGSLSTYLDSGASPALGAWQHVAATSDGVTARYYVDGVQVASRAISGSVGSSNTWRIGAYGAAPGGFLDGVVDDVRVYNRALSEGEIQFDRDHGVVPLPVPPDTTPPSAPGTLIATGAVGQVNLNWGAATDNLFVSSYNVHRSTSAGFTPSAGEPDRRAHRHDVRGHRARGRRHLLLQGHRRGRGDQRRPGVERGDRSRLRSDPAERARHAHRHRRLRPGVAVVGRGHRQRRRHPLQRPPLDDLRLHADRAGTGSHSRPARASRTPGRARHLLLQGDRRGRRRQRRPGLEPGERRRAQRHDAAERVDHARQRRARSSPG